MEPSNRLIMHRALYSVLPILFFSFLLGTPQIYAQSNPNSAPAPSSSSKSPIALPVAQPVSPTSAANDDSAPMQNSDFIINGVSYAEVLYLEGNVWIRPPTDTTFHRLAEDEPIAANSLIATGFNGILDFAVGPGMAVRMVPGTVLLVDQLPQPPPITPTKITPATTPTPETVQVAVRKGTIFSALGREDGQPIDYRVRTPEGVAGARGTMFSTSATPSTSAAQGQAEVNMLHGTVNFETPDHQTSQIVAGQSQQISGSTVGKFQLGKRQTLNPAESDTFFNHAGGLLEHSSGYGVVRRGLGPDIAKTLQARGFKWSPTIQQRFQNAAKMHFKNRPTFNGRRGVRATGTGTGTGAKTVTPQVSRPFLQPPNNRSSSNAETNRMVNPERERPVRRPLRDENGVDRRDRNVGE